MASKIKVLTEDTINKIAAGEVIENPASVVKELVENSLDAGATEICIEIRGGGRQLVRITDNGSGMNADDALLCLERHATSKIRNVDDIFDISSMGFRGEAVPSIASISKFTLITSENGSDGTLVIVEGGKILKCAPAIRAKGTTIEVKSLFYNVPVRKKFQKSPTYDTNEILKMVSTLALGYPEITFQLISDQKELLHTKVSEPGENLAERIKEILGADFLEQSCPIDTTINEMRLYGRLGMAAYTRHNRTGQFLFINKRAVTSPLIVHCIREGYGTMLSTNRHPVFVLHLTLPGPTVDVNVHPQKKEVRIRQDQQMRDSLIESIRKGLQQVEIFSEGISFTDIALPDHIFLDKPTYIPPFQDTLKSAEPPLSLPIQRPVEATQKNFQFEQPAKKFQILGTIKDFILVDGSVNDGKSALGLIDQKSALARIIFEKMDSENSTEPLAQQILMVPYILETSPIETACIHANMELFQKFGLSLNQMGPHSFSIDAFPQIYEKADMISLVRELIKNLQEDRVENTLAQHQQRRSALMATHSAKLLSRKLSIEESEKLVKLLMQCKNPLQCPMGKPILLFLTSEEIAKKFQKD